MARTKDNPHPDRRRGRAEIRRTGGKVPRYPAGKSPRTTTAPDPARARLGQKTVPSPPRPNDNNNSTLREWLEPPDTDSDSRETSEDREGEREEGDRWTLLPLEDLERRLYGERKTIVMSQTKFDVLFKMWMNKRRISDPRFRMKNKTSRRVGRVLLEKMVIDTAETAARMAEDLKVVRKSGRVLQAAPNAMHLRLASDCLFGQYNPFRRRRKEGPI